MPVKADSIRCIASLTFLLPLGRSYCLFYALPLLFLHAQQSYAQSKNPPEKKKEAGASKALEQKEGKSGAASPLESSKSFQDSIMIREERSGQAPDRTYQRIPLHQGEHKTASKISDVVEKQSGARLNRFGAPGSFSHLSIRGASPAQSGIYIAGILLNGPLESVVNLENLPIELFESIELYRSWTPLHLRGNHIGGAIDMIPHSLGAGKKFAFLKSELSSLQGASLGLGLALPWTLQAVKVEGSKNRYQYYDDNGTPLVNQADDSVRTRENEDYKAWSYTGLFTYETGDHVLKALIDGLEKERGVPGPIGDRLRSVRFEERRKVAKLLYQRFWGEYFRIEGSAALQQKLHRLQDPEEELAASLIAQKRTVEQVQWALRPAWYFFDDSLSLQSSLSMAQSNVRRNGAGLAKREEREAGWALSFQEELWGQALLQEKYLSVRDQPQKALLLEQLPAQTELASFQEQYQSRSARLAFFPLAFLQRSRAKQKRKQRRVFLETHIMFSSNSRLPSITEKYGDGVFTRPNLELRKEKSQSLDYGLNGKFRHKGFFFRLSASSYRKRAKDLILFVQNSPRTIRAENASSADISGYDMEIHVEYMPWLLTKLRYSQLEARDSSEGSFFKGNFLPFHPRHMLEYYLESGNQRYRPFLRIHYLGLLYRDRNNSDFKLVEGRKRIDIGISAYFQKEEKSHLSFVVQNVMNAYHSDYLGYPMPNRTYKLQIYKEFYIKQ